MNLCIFGYYRFADGYYAYGQYFKKYFDTVSFFPLVEFINFKRDDLSDIEKVISGESIDLSHYTNSINVTNVPKQIIVIPHNNDFIIDKKKYFDFIFSLKNKYHFKIIQINWDPCITNLESPYSFDLTFCSDPLYITNSSTLFFSSGFSPLTSYHDFSVDYECDVSFVGTNLYTNAIFPNQSMNRKKILDLIYNDPSIKLHVYGNESIKNSYPKCYKGFISYSNCYRVFSSSKINLNISPVLDTPENYRKHEFVYYSERLPQILAANGVLLCNNDLSPLLLPGIHYIYIQSLDQLIPTIKDYLNHPERLQTIKNNTNQILHKFNYENIVKNISNIITMYP